MSTGWIEMRAQADGRSIAQVAIVLATIVFGIPIAGMAAKNSPDGMWILVGTAVIVTLAVSLLSVLLRT